MHKPTVWDEIDEAELRVAKRVLLTQGRLKFGDPTAKMETSLSAIKELPRLERMCAEILTATSWKELLAVK